MEPPLNPLLEKEGILFPLLFKERVRVRLAKKMAAEEHPPKA
jgi:hypothetical protein